MTLDPQTKTADLSALDVDATLAKQMAEKIVEQNKSGPKPCPKCESQRTRVHGDKHPIGKTGLIVQPFICLKCDKTWSE